MIFIFRLSSILNWAIKLLLLGLFIILILGTFLPNIDSTVSFPFLDKIKTIDGYLIELAQQTIPLKYKHQDISRYFALIICFIMLWISLALQTEIRYRINIYKARLDAKKISQSLGSSSNNQNLAKLDAKLEEIESAKRHDRKHLLEEFVNLKKQLDEMTKNIAFLSVDVVDSTGMKLGEDTYIITNDFLEYRKFVEAILTENKYIKSTWTPDGLMVCFASLENAIQSAQTLLKGLEYFNRNIKNMKRDFVIRCGVNAGKLFFDDSLPLEQISDRVIDIAGHMQKYAAPSSIFVAQSLVEGNSLFSDFIPAGKEVDGLAVYKWTYPANNTIS